MGTPDFAVPSLEILINAGYDIVGVITSTDKWGGRGRKELIQSDIKKYALEKGLNVLQPPNLKSPQFLEDLSLLKADLQLVVAFRMLPEVVWNMPKHGTYNLHGSLLPDYRGAAPINWAIINGDETTGVTTFKLRHEIDTGSIAFQQSVPITKDDNFESLYNRMKIVGSELVLKTVKAIEDNSISFHIQDESKVSNAPKIFHQDCQINIDKNPYQLYNYIRGLSPYPTAWTSLDNKKMKIFAVRYSFEQHNYHNGAFVVLGKKELRLYVSEGYLTLEDIQLEGRKRLDIKSFLNGINPQDYSSLFRQ